MPLAGFCEAVWIACGSNFQFGFVWQKWHGQLSPSFKFEIKVLECENSTASDPASACRILGGKGCVL